MVAVGAPLALGRGRIALTEFINGFTIGKIAFGEFPTDPAVWLELRADDTVVLHSPKAEMGQGIHTALAQIAAAELGARFAQVLVVQASTSRGFGPKNLDTGGSFSTKSIMPPLRQVCALLRGAIAAAGAQALGVDPSAISVEQGQVRGPSTSLTFGQLVATNPTWKWPATATLRPLEEFKARLTGPPRAWKGPPRATGRRSSATT